jgi:MYXO-CTERM domain-containing protein
MRTKLLLFLQFTALMGAAITGTGPAPAPCVTATLDVYESLGAGGCSIEDFTFMNFTFETLSATGGAIPITSSDITVRPSSAGGNLSVAFFSPGFSVAGSEFVQYQINYLVDPLPPVIIRYDEDMFAESPVAPGTADINTALCIGATFSAVNGLCSPDGTSAFLNTFHHGTANDTKLFDSVTFPGVYMVDVKNTITLAANGATSQIDGFGNTAGTAPEPGAWLLAASGLLAVVLRRKRAKVL